MRLFLASAMVALAGVLPGTRRFTHDVAVNAKSDQVLIDELNEKLKASDARTLELRTDLDKALSTNTELLADLKKVQTELDTVHQEKSALTIELADVREDLDDALKEIARLNSVERIGPAIDLPSEEFVPVETWAKRQLAIFRRSTVGEDVISQLDPDVREKIRAGLTIEQAIEVVSVQKQHDAVLAESQPANPAE